MIFPKDLHTGDVVHVVLRQNPKRSDTRLQIPPKYLYRGGKNQAKNCQNLCRASALSNEGMHKGDGVFCIQGTRAFLEYPKHPPILFCKRIREFRRIRSSCM
ncbi:hypothetical protein TorRG33x02_289220 [Trema orientale]|uniref:Uncharacterized protein n=1 Tax=Trema orientale TaxID=63057 RepID=A0A2P5CD93_TREOI|nr:hypothetical protein TorRG33x02_289220 [Trema orientale]